MQANGVDLTVKAGRIGQRDVCVCLCALKAVAKLGLSDSELRTQIENLRHITGDMS